MRPAQIVQRLVLERPMTGLGFSAGMRGLVDSNRDHPNRSDSRLLLTAPSRRQQLIYAAFIAGRLANICLGITNSVIQASIRRVPFLGDEPPR